MTRIRNSGGLTHAYKRVFHIIPAHLHTHVHMFSKHGLLATEKGNPWDSPNREGA